MGESRHVFLRPGKEKCFDHEGMAPTVAHSGGLADLFDGGKKPMTVTSFLVEAISPHFGTDGG
ncbi:hypothetical protein [Amycolatopsis sp. NPDC049868]|uniref:hypothetical protein n=1 Tax=Amycolatopsis sp. NPDC049868 TaxID=3363934 RepID=UPI0037912402